MQSIARHVLGFHRNASSAQAVEATPSPVDQERLRKYINFARRYGITIALHCTLHYTADTTRAPVPPRTCGPRLSADAANKLRDEFVKIRSTTRGHRSVIPITIRYVSSRSLATQIPEVMPTPPTSSCSQLEAIVRMSEALAKMRLAKFATESDVEEALRLFRISTLQAAMNNELANGPEGNQAEANGEMLLDIERMIKRRMPMGAKVSERTIIDDLCNRKVHRRASLHKVLTTYAIDTQHCIHNFMR